MRAISTIGLVAAIGAGAALWLDGQRQSPPPETAPAALISPAYPAPARPATDDGRVTQSYSSKCSTGAAICIVPAQPVGSPCSCGGTPGTIIP